jgi:tRNA-Thr(GGU) m(6)t(6)A37 methyltransferase TsaA
MQNPNPKRTEIKLRPIGVAYRTEREDTMRIVVHPDYAEGLDGIEELDYIDVLYWMHTLSEEERGILKTHPRGDLSRPLRGVFSLRSPVRPNPIGLTRVRLVKREGDNLLVEDLDALDGSPVIDIKSG